MQKLKKLSVLLVDDDERSLALLAEYLKRPVGEVYTAANAVDGFELYKQKRPDVVISDIHMPAMNGLELLECIRQDNADTFVLIMTAFSDLRQMEIAQKYDANLFIKKPLDLDELVFMLGGISKKIYKNELFLDGDFVLKEGVLHGRDGAVHLSQKERAVLTRLSKRAGKVVCAEELCESCELTSGALRNHISQINKKASIQLIKNISGQGYILSTQI